MTIDLQDVYKEFRGQYPAFASTGEYPDSMLLQGLSEGDVETGGSGWGTFELDLLNFKERGMFLFAAHWIQATYPSGASGGMSGGIKLITDSVSVGDESVSYSQIGGSDSSDAGTAWLSVTAYGQQFMRLRKRAGMAASPDPKVGGDLLMPRVTIPMLPLTLITTSMWLIRVV